MLASIVTVTQQDMSAAMPLLVLAVGAIACMVLDAFRGGSRISFWLLPLTLVVAAFFQINLLETSERWFEGFYRTTKSSGLINLLFFGIALFTWAVSVRFEREQRPFHSEYHTLILFATAGALLMTGAGHLLTAFIGLEVLSLSLYVLTAWRRERRASVEAGLKYFLLGSFAAAILLYGMALLFASHRELLYLGLPAQYLLNLGGDATLRNLGLLMILAALLFKISAAPFHMWTPDVYQGAPTPITALMSTGTKAAALALMTLLLPLLPANTVIFFACIALLTMLVGNCGALLQSNVKRLLAYSSIAHAGYMLVAICAAVNQESALGEGISAVYFYLVTYTLTNLAAFGLLSYIETRVGRELSLADLGGISARFPWCSGALALAMLSLAGIPPLAGFFGKYYVFAAAVHADLMWLALAGVLLSVVSLGYYLRVVCAVYMDPPPETEAPQEFARTSLAAPGRLFEAVALTVVTLGILAIGFFPARIAGLFG